MLKFINNQIILLITMSQEEYEDVTELDLIYEAHDKIDVLIDLLVEKGVISTEEYTEKLEEHFDKLESEAQE